MPGKKEMPSTLKRSPKKAQDTWVKTHDSAVKEYGEGRRAHQTAFASLKHSFQKIGDHWESKNQKGPSDEKAKTPHDSKQHDKAKSYGGVDVKGNSKEDLINIAKKVGVTGYSGMNKDELAKAIKKANDKKTAQARD